MESGEASEVKTFSLTRGVQVLQAGTKLGQAQLQLELGFTLLKVCCITYPLTCILACLLSYIPAYKGDQTVLYQQLIPTTPNHILAIHLISTDYT